MTNAIAVEGLRKGFNKVEAVAGLSFSIQQGEAVHEHMWHEIDCKQKSGQPTVIPNTKKTPVTRRKHRLPDGDSHLHFPKETYRLVGQKDTVLLFFQYLLCLFILFLFKRGTQSN